MIVVVRLHLAALIDLPELVKQLYANTAVGKMTHVRLDAIWVVILTVGSVALPKRRLDHVLDSVAAGGLERFVLVALAK